jgi:hypothetical protein
MTSEIRFVQTFSKAHNAFKVPKSNLNFEIEQGDESFHGSNTIGR